MAWCRDYSIDQRAGVLDQSIWWRGGASCLSLATVESTALSRYRVVNWYWIFTLHTSDRRVSVSMSSSIDTSIILGANFIQIDEHKTSIWWSLIWKLENKRHINRLGGIPVGFIPNPKENWRPLIISCRHLSRTAHRKDSECRQMLLASGDRASKSSRCGSHCQHLNIYIASSRRHIITLCRVMSH